MWPYYPELLERPAPRYTSYPTAAEFSPDVGMVDMARALEAVQRDEDISLYIHIPYCHEICWYCGCNTGAASKPRRLAAYVEALEHEIALVARKLNGRGRIRRIAWGGGSPNALAPVDFVRLMQHILLCFGALDPEIGVEVDPRSLDQQWIDTLGAIGVGRISMGVQTFSPDIQKQIGRIQPFDMVERITASLRRAGVRTIGFDLMYGLPGQSTDELEETLALAATTGPDRVALFGYAHMPRLLPRQRRIDATSLPDRAARFAQAQLGHDILTELGYRTVGFDHFAKPHDALARAAAKNTLHRNFQGFTDDTSRILIGLGASAISQFPGIILQNEKNVGHYRMRLSADQLPATRGVTIGADDARRAQVIFDILCYGRARLTEDLLTPEAISQLAPFMDRQLAGYDGDALVLAPEAMPYRRSIAAVFDSYLAPQETRFSNAI